MTSPDPTGKSSSWRPALAAMLPRVVENDAQGVTVAVP